MSQWAGLMAPPMSVLWHIVMSSRSDGKLYIWPVFIWWNSLETTLVTGLLLLVAPVHRLAALGACRIIMCLSRVSADCCCVQWTVFLRLFSWISLWP